LHTVCRGVREHFSARTFYRLEQRNRSEVSSQFFTHLLLVLVLVLVLVLLLLLLLLLFVFFFLLTATTIWEAT